MDIAKTSLRYMLIEYFIYPLNFFKIFPIFASFLTITMVVGVAIVSTANTL